MVGSIIKVGPDTLQKSVIRRLIAPDSSYGNTSANSLFEVNIFLVCAGMIAQEYLQCISLFSSQSRRWMTDSLGI